MDEKIKNCAYIFDRNETLVQLDKAHKSFPFDVSPATVQRWFRRGVSTPHGHFRLETAVSGSKRFTSEEAIGRFLRAQQGENVSSANAAPVPTSVGMTAAERKREMKRLGLRPQAEPKTAKPQKGGA